MKSGIAGRRVLRRPYGPSWTSEKKTCSDLSDGARDAPSQNLTSSSYPELSAPAGWVWGEEHDTDSRDRWRISHNRPAAPRAPITQDTPGEWRGTARDGDRLEKELKPWAPASDLSGWVSGSPEWQQWNAYIHRGLPTRSFSVNLGWTDFFIIRKAASWFFYTWQAKYFPSPILWVDGSTDTR